MENLRPLAGPLDDALASLRRTALPGMSDDEADAFSLGFWAGAMAQAIGAAENGIKSSEIAERVEAELTRIEQGRSPE
jgi:hypothetical protein